MATGRADTCAPRTWAISGAVLLLLGCGGGERAAPEPVELLMAKPASGSGDQQVGTAGTRLPAPLRVVVTQDSQPVSGAVVRWVTREGSLSPTTTITDAAGAASAWWTLQRLYAQQVAAATLDGSSGPGVRFTAIATPDPSASTSVRVGPDGELRFSPAALTIVAGDTVNWVWPPGSMGHNVVPDDGDTPPQSGALVGYPAYHSYRFVTPGVYHYYCMAHGTAGGGGMSGTITVLPSVPAERRR